MKKYKEWLTNEIEIMESETSENYPHEQMVEREVVLNLIDQLDEPEKVVIPGFVADEFDYNKKPYWEVIESKDVSHILKCAFGNEGKPSEFLDWVRENPEDYVMVVRNGYEVEEEPLYRALIKGHELIDGAKIYWYFDIPNDGVFVSKLYPTRDNFIFRMSKSEWNRLGINDSNADFVKLLEVAE